MKNKYIIYNKDFKEILNDGHVLRLRKHPEANFYFSIYKGYDNQNTVELIDPLDYPELVDFLLREYSDMSTFNKIINERKDKS